MSADGQPTFVVARFATPEPLTNAVERLCALGYRRSIDVHSAYPVDQAMRALGLRRSWVPTLVLGGGLIGGSLGYLLQWWTSSVDFPINVGGRPFHSAPAFVPITFELAILFASLTAFFGSLALAGLPRPHHPVFEWPGFARASHDQFALSVEVRATPEELDRIEEALRQAGALDTARLEPPR